MSNYASGDKHAKHRYILAVNLPDTFRCPKRQIATKKYKIICLSSMFYLNQKKKRCKVQFAHCLFKICPPINDSIQPDFWPFSYGVTHLLRKQYPYIWLPFQHHSIFVICPSDFSSSYSKIYPGMLSVFWQRVGHKFVHFPFPNSVSRENKISCHLLLVSYKIKNVQQVVRQLYLLISLQILRIKIIK